MARPVSARLIALDVLDRVLGEARPLEETFAGHPALALLDPRDRAFARLLVTTVLRRLGQIDALLDRFMRARPKAIRVHDLLRLGAAQLLFLDTPAHAAVGETVALASGPHAYAKGLVNAVLRRVAREGKEDLARQDAPRLNTPDWLWESWKAVYGEPAAHAIADAHLAEPPLDLTVKADPEDWAARLGGERLYGNTVRRPAGGAIEDLPGYAEGAWWIQDAAAALPARLLGDVRRAHCDRSVRGARRQDRAAGRGGRRSDRGRAVGPAGRPPAQQSPAPPARGPDRGGRCARLATAAGRSAACCWMRRVPPPARSAGIRISPGTSLPADVTRMAALQQRLLEAAVAMLEPGGMLVYASCSLQPEEGPQVIERALARGLPVARQPVEPSELDGLAVDLTSEGDVRTLPCQLAGRGGLDGFFIARLRRHG